jgi:hypothetical protein
MNQSFSPDGPTEQSAFEGYMLQVFPRQSSSEIDVLPTSSPLQLPFCLSSNSDLFDCGPSPDRLIAAQKLLSMFEKLEGEFARDREYISKESEGFHDLLKHCYKNDDPFAVYIQNNNLFMAIVGFASYDPNKASDANCFFVDSQLFVWADVQKYGGNIGAFSDAVEQYAINNRAGFPNLYRNSDGSLNQKEYSLAIQNTVNGGAQQFPPYYNCDCYYDDARGWPLDKRLGINPMVLLLERQFLKR